MNAPGSNRPVERLFPFVLRARILMVGRETIRRCRSKLHFVLITTDLSPGSLEEILKDFNPYPIVQLYTSAELENWFHIKGAKVIGFAKSGLAQSIYAEMKEYRLNRPAVPNPKTTAAPKPDAEENTKGGESV